MYASELGSTSSPDTFRFQSLSAGNTGQPSSDTLLPAWAGWGRAGLRLLDVVASVGTTSSTEFGPYYAMACADSELLLSRVLWSSPAFGSRVNVVVEATHRYALRSVPELTLITDTPDGIAIGISPHPDREPPKRLELVFRGAAARPGFSRNVEQARWIYQRLRPG